MIDPLTYRRLVYKVAHSFSRSSRIPVEDLAQTGMIGLLKSISRYEPEKGAFQTFATYYIKGEILRAIANEYRLIRLPHNVTDALTKVANLERKYKATHNKDPTDEERAKWLGWTAERYRRCRDLSKLSAWPTDCELTPLADRSNTPWQAIEKEEKYARLRLAISSLPQRQRDAIVLVYGLDGEEMTKREAAERLGVSGMTVARDIRKGMRSLREKLSVAS